MQSIIFLALVSVVAAQTLVPTSSSSTFPGCALSCTTLLQAQQGCIPPSAPVTNEATYVSCFCQSTLLSALYNSPDGTCDTQCTIETDRQLLQSWYKGFCASGGAGASAATASTASTTLGTSTTSATTSATGVGSSSGTVSSNSKSWIDTHWRWILMAAILVVGLAVIAFLAICLKRRHRRKVENRRIAASGFTADGEKSGDRPSSANLEALFGPAQHMAATRGWEYTHDQDRALETGGVPPDSRRKDSRRVKRHRSGKGKSRDRTDVHEIGGDSIHEIDGSSNEARSGRTKSTRRREREMEREKNREIEQRLRGVKGKDVDRDKDGGRN